MSLRALNRLLIAYVGALLVLSFVVQSRASLGAIEPKTVDDETAVQDAPLSLDPRVLPWSLVSGRDGVRADLDGRTAWLTTTELVRARAYDSQTTLFDPTLGIGAHTATVLHLLAQKLGTTPADVQARATARRVRFEPVTRPTEPTLDRAHVEEAVHEAARHLARGVDGRGRFRYLVDVVTGQSVGGYNWPRHAAATYFLAQSAAYFPDDTSLSSACLRAAARLRDEQILDCGSERCIGEDNEVDLGSSALAVLAFTEIVKTGLDPSYLRSVRELASFIRSQQRPDGELMHLYDRKKKERIDRQFLYTTGEASLALSRAHRVTNDPRDLGAASRALAYVAGAGWQFFGSRYLFAEEHWTCQAAEDQWDRAPNRDALDFCARWHAFNRSLQVGAGESPFGHAAEGAFAFGPFLTPRTTPAASRGEAAAAAFAVLRGEDLSVELRDALTFVLRAQLRPDVPGSRHLSAQPSVNEATRGAILGSAVDPQIRIDYAQHAGSLMLRWLALYPDPH